MPNRPAPIELYRMGPMWGLPTISPFGLKLTAWLRIAGIDHVVKVEDDPRKGPKKKSPWVVLDGRPMGDSELIIAHLSARYGVDTEARLTARERAVGLALRRTFEEHYVQALEQVLFIDEDGWRQSVGHFDFLPTPVRPLVRNLIRGSIRKEIYVRGLGRHTREEMTRMAAADLDMANELLGDGSFFFGDAPTLTDCSVYAFLALTLAVPVASAEQTHLRSLPRLSAFCRRMDARVLDRDSVAA